MSSGSLEQLGNSEFSSSWVPCIRFSLQTGWNTMAVVGHFLECTSATLTFKHSQSQDCQKRLRNKILKEHWFDTVQRSGIKNLTYPISNFCFPGDDLRCLQHCLPAEIMHTHSLHCRKSCIQIHSTGKPRVSCCTIPIFYHANWCRMPWRLDKIQAPSEIRKSDIKAEKRREKDGYRVRLWAKTEQPHCIEWLEIR